MKSYIEKKFRAPLLIAGVFIIILLSGLLLQTCTTGGNTQPALPDIYSAGYTRNSDGLDFSCYWKNGVRNDLNVPDDTKPGGAQ